MSQNDTVKTEKNCKDNDDQKHRKIKPKGINAKWLDMF